MATVLGRTRLKYILEREFDKSITVGASIIRKKKTFWKLFMNAGQSCQSNLTMIFNTNCKLTFAVLDRSSAKKKKCSKIISEIVGRKQVAQGQYVVSDTRCPALHD